MTTGTYLEIDSRPALRFVREYRHPVERVWEAVTDPAGLTAWFPARVAFPDDGRPRPGAEVRFTFGTDGDGGTGTVLAVEPPSRLVLTWGGDELRFELTALATGSRLTFTTLLEDPGTAARNAAGWEVCLDALDGALDAAPDGGTLDGGTLAAPGGPTPAWRRHFDEYVAAGVPSGAPVPGM